MDIIEMQVFVRVKKLQGKFMKLVNIIFKVHRLSYQEEKSNLFSKVLVRN